tara:strand:- start:2954 stop:3868 length:915 start_codon:yes stop_codon:yes gene_type:complete
MFNRIIAIGDLHGDYEVFLKLLKTCKLIDDNGNWSGGNTYLIQMGDILDGKRPGIKIDKLFLNSPGEWNIIKKIIVLDSQARLKGGRVISILGNHELYPFYFSDDPSFEKDYVKKSDSKKIKEIFGISRTNFFKPGGAGAKLFSRTRPLILKLGKVLFVHGSVTNSMIKSSIENGYVNIDKINKEVSDWLLTGKTIPEYLKDTSNENPLFSRNFSDNRKYDEDTCEMIRKQLENFKNVEHVIMGHTTFKSINATCDKLLIRTDISLSRAFGGKLKDKKLQALEIIQNKNETKFNIISPNGIVPM